MPAIAMKHDTDPRLALQAQVGDVSGFEIAQNELLIAIYRRPEKTSGGIVLPKSNLDEDLYQSKTGLVIKMGSACRCVRRDERTGVSYGIDVKVGDWIIVRPSDTLAMDVKGVGAREHTACRLVYDDRVRGRVPNPDVVW
jgi:co-chaperonin GroES (HSP10)